jgi:hypothetical protein
MLEYNVCGIRGTKMASAYDIPNYISSVPQWNKGVLPMNPEIKMIVCEGRIQNYIQFLEFMKVSAYKNTV